MENQEIIQDAEIVEDTKTLIEDAKTMEEVYAKLAEIRKRRTFKWSEFNRIDRAMTLIANATDQMYMDIGRTKAEV